MGYRITYIEQFSSEKQQQPPAEVPFVVVTNPNLSPSPNADDPGAYRRLQDKALEVQSLETFSRKKCGGGGRPHVNFTLSWEN